jgi:hypothetical protein
MRNGIPVEELKKIPWFDATAVTSSRAILSTCFFVKGEWHSWFWADGQLRPIFMQPVEASYFGDAPERETDPCFRLLELAAQKISFVDMVKASIGITHDFRNLATSLAKIKCFFELSKTRKSEVSRFVQTEMEYMIYVCRSVFDLLQEMFAKHWEKVELKDTSIRKRKLPKSFADVVLHGDRIRTDKEIMDKYGLPQSFANWYLAHAQFFVQIRTLRNAFDHRGETACKVVFCTERGFAIHREEPQWCTFYDWPKEAELRNELVPLRPVLNMILANLINVTDTLAQVLDYVIQLPKPYFPNLHYFTRGHYDREFKEMGDVLKNCLWDDTEATISIAAMSTAH